MTGEADPECVEVSLQLSVRWKALCPRTTVTAGSCLMGTASRIAGTLAKNIKVQGLFTFDFYLRG